MFVAAAACLFVVYCRSGCYYVIILLLAVAVAVAVAVVLVVVVVVVVVRNPQNPEAITPYNTELP